MGTYFVFAADLATFLAVLTGYDNFFLALYVPSLVKSGFTAQLTSKIRIPSDAVFNATSLAKSEGKKT